MKHVIIALLLSLILSTSCDSLPAETYVSHEIQENALVQGNTEITPKEENVYVMKVMSNYEDIYERLKSCETYYPMFDVVEEEAVAEAPMDYAVSIESSAELTNQVTAEKDYSKTNTQLADVDEGDIVKTDGKYIYMIQNGASLCIMSADGENSALVSKTELDSTDYASARELYLGENTLAIVSEHRKENKSLWWDPSVYYTTVTVYDITDPAFPKKIAKTGQDGSYTTSRMIEDDIYLITRHQVSSYRDFEPEDYEFYVPALYANDTETLIEPGCIVCPQRINESCYTVITKYSAENGEAELNKTVLGAGSTVYMNTENLYLADEYYFSEESEPYTDSVYTVVDYKSGTRTEIFRFDLSEGIKTKAVGTVEGSLLNQFAMDEYNGTFRVVTTENNSSYSVYTDEKHGFTNYKWHDSGRTNGLYVFDETMEIIGKIDGLAEGEQVYSVRFSGNTAYFVTFRTVDPLFTVDLSDPGNPVILSELKIPGFSNYLHPYADGLLFGFGQDADPNTGRTRGMKLSMFDVSDPHAVSEKHCLKLEYSYSDALYNHKAILISAEKDLIGFPTEQGYAIYGYDSEKGFYKKAETKLEKMWSSDLRGMYAGEYVYIVTHDFTSVMTMDALDLVKSIEY